MVGSFRKALVGHVRWLAAFTLLLFISTAVPVLADPEAPAEDPPIVQEDPTPVPGDEEMAKALEEAERKEEERKEEQEEALSSPAAVQEREASREAYGDLSATEAQDLLFAAFPEQLKALNADPARVLSDLDVEKTLGTYGAQVTDEDGSTSLVESPIPIESELPGGKEEQVDLSLEDAGSGFEPETGFTEVRLPDSLGGSIEVGESLAIDELPGNGSVAATRFGDKDLFFANSDTATDTLVSPIARGVEIFEQLRSPASPEQFRFGLSVPEGAILRSDGQGGAEIVDSSDERIGTVPAPYAVDAQGTEVPVTLTVEGDSIVLDVPHRSHDIAYPILVDPIMEDWQGWYVGWNGYGLGYWGWQETADYEAGYNCIVNCWGPGLYTRSRGSSYSYPPNTYGQWLYTAPNSTAFISRAVFQAINGSVNNCWEYQPHGYVGIYNVYSNSWNSLGIYSPTSIGMGNYETGWVGGNGTRLAVVGIGTGNNWSTLKCGHDFAVGGAMIWEDDPENPTVNWVNGIPSGWVSDTTPFTIGYNVSDPGLGIQFVTISPEGMPIIQHQVGCSGLAQSRCPASRQSAFSNLTGASFDEGEKGAKLSASDPLGKGSITYPWTMKVDRTPPEVTLSGQLATVTNEAGSSEVPPGKGDELSLPVYNLKIEAKDGSNATKAQKRSGVKNIEIFLDSESKAETVPWSAQSCPESSCGMTKTFELKLHELSAGKHTLKVFAVDQVGKKRERKIEFEYIPATGIKDEYIMHYFPLSDGEGSEAKEEFPDRPELAVNVINGNLVYREKDIEVEGAAVDLEVERYYNSQLPNEDNTEWGDGWTLAQTPTLEPEKTEGGPPLEAKLVDVQGGLKGSLGLPTETGATQFDPKLQATVTKNASGYELTDETGESAGAISFDSQGKTQELQTDGWAKVDYDYEAGELAEIAVEDPASASKPTEEVEPPDPVPTFAISFGSNGAGDGQFKSPADVAVDAVGNLWVVDKANNRIQKFNSKGEYQSKFGTFGTGNGQLSGPAGVAIDAQGNIWVADSGNRRVQKFNSKGEYQSQFGSQGSGNGQFSSWGPKGIGIDAQGNIWVSDYSGRIQKFNAKGEFVKVVGSGQFGESAGLGIGGGKVWVGDWTNNRLSVFSEAGEYLFKVGSSGTGPGQFSHPDAVDVDSQGNVWVADQSNHRVQQLDQQGKYVAQFGSKGSGAGQFNFAWPMGLSVDEKGRIWVTDVSNHRIQQWAIPGYVPTYGGSFGGSGTGNGQFSQPGDVAFDPAGYLWVADKGNSRVQKFNLAGEYLGQLGSVGTGPGQFKKPDAIEVDPKGNIWVADSGNNRIQKFNSEGEFLLKCGSAGSGNGQFSGIGPKGLAVDAQNNIWATDYSGRVQKFNEVCQFVKSIGSSGSGGGQFIESAGIDVGGGKIWVSDWVNDRVSVFNEAGEYLFKFGSSGSGNGQLDGPDGVEVDGKGHVWVLDVLNSRVQQFNQSGEYQTKFGSSGSGEGQFSLTWPVNLTSNGNGRIWVTDFNNGRIQEWHLLDDSPTFEPNDPAVEIETPGGLVSSVEGEEAGEHSYEHVGDLLTSHDGPDGETNYGYDEAGRLSLIQLPDGTTAVIKYHTTYGRVKSVTVDLAGPVEAKTTNFEYSDEPRRTTVTPPGDPAVTYDIGADGSVLKWWNAKVPPDFDDLSGSLYANKETSSPITTGDHNLVVQAHSEEGIASIQVIANGTQLIDEVTCAQDFEKAGIECVKVPNEWVTNTENHAPGVLNLEVTLKDRLGQMVSKRFWVNIPSPPPPLAEGTPVPPKFAEILNFREEYGLDVVDPVADEFELNDRIFDLIGAWHNPQTPAGEVARASWERWGVPLRVKDIEELEYRERYLANNAPIISQWGSSTASSTYAGYYMDHRAGGKIRIGFTTSQGSMLAVVKQLSGLMATDRITPFSTQPVWSLAHLSSISQDFDQEITSHPSIRALLTAGELDVQGNKILIGTSDVGQVNNFLQSNYGSTTAISAYFDPHTPTKRVEIDGGARARQLDNTLYSGDYIRLAPEEGGCTLGFGAWEESSNTSPSGAPLLAHFGLTAGHCYSVGNRPKRGGYKLNSKSEVIPGQTSPLGTVRRNSSGLELGDTGFESEAAAIRLNETTMVPRRIFWSTNKFAPHVNGSMAWVPGMTLCHSGTYGGSRCGPTGPKLRKTYWGGDFFQWEIIEEAYSECGDSGSPVWDPITGKAVGILNGGNNCFSAPTWVVPLESLEGRPELPEVIPGSLPGALKAPEMAPLFIVGG